MVDQQQFCLRWNNHGSTLVAVFDNLLASESLVDVTLFAEGHLLKAHKVVLSACSPYFQTLFAQTTDKHPIVILKDVKHVELKALLDYMYRGEVNVSQDQLGPLIKTAESLKIKGLADGTNKREVDSRVSHPAGPIIPKTENSLVGAKCGRPGLDSNFPAPSVSVPSVLSTVLTMPPALSLASSNLVPSIKLPNLATTTVVDSSPQEDNDTPQAKRRKKMRRKSGDVSCGGGDSGDSDSRSSGSPRDGIHLPRIPATITPIPPLHQSHLQDQLQQQHKEREKDFERELEREREREQQERERERERDREQELERERERERDREREQESMREVQEQLRSSSPPENLVGSSSRGDCVIDIPRSSPGGITRPFSDIDYGCDSMNKSLGQHSRPDENSSDANHQSDDEYEERGIMSRIYQDHPDTPGPSTSRLPPEDSPHPPGYLGWPYPPDTPGSEESFSALENPNQGHHTSQAPTTAASASSGRAFDCKFEPTSPSPSPSSVLSSPAKSLISPLSPNGKADLVYLSKLKQISQNHPEAVSRLEMLSRILAHRALSDSTPHPEYKQTFPLNLSYTFQNSDTKPFLDMRETFSSNFTSVSPFQHTDSKPIPNLLNSTSHTKNNHLMNSTKGGSIMDVPLMQATSSTNGGILHACNRCGKSYGVRRSLHRHQKFECGVEPKFRCPLCSKKCTHKFNLKQHILSHHKH